MHEISEHAVICTGSQNRPFLVRAYVPQPVRGPLVLWLHGFKGFSDWGPFPAACRAMAQAGFAVAQVNFSHNGTSPQHPADFVDLEAFSVNTYGMEVQDATAAMRALLGSRGKELGIAADSVYVVGHSRGGGIAMLFTDLHPQVIGLTTWAGVADFNRRMKARQMQYWKDKGVIYTFNARTQQHMPMRYSIWEDYEQHANDYDLEACAKRLHKPWLILHGSADEAVPVAEAKQLSIWQPNAQTCFLQGANHTFGGKHPWLDNHLPPHLEHVVTRTLRHLSGIC